MGLFLVIFVGLVAVDRSVNFTSQSNQILLLNNNPGGFEVEFQLGEYKLIEAQTKGGIFDVLHVDGYAYTNKIGEPNLPLARKIIAVPVGADVRFTFSMRNQMEISASDNRLKNKIMPAQEPVSKSADPAMIPFEYKAGSYSRDTFTDDEVFSVKEIGYMRGVRLFAVDFVPFSYNPVSGSLKVTHQLVARVDFINPDYRATEDLLAKTASWEYENLYSRTIFNWRNDNRASLVRYPTKMIILTPSAYVSTLEPFVQWKREQGFHVTVTTVGSGATVANTTTAIKSYMQNLWDNATAQDPAPSYLLIVGDHSTSGNNITANTGAAGSHVTDLTYVRLNGTDYLPEMYYGRFSVSSATELTNIINKTLMFQKTTMPDLSYLGKTVLIAGADASWAPTHGNGAINYATTQYFNAANGITSNNYLYPASESSSAQIIANANEGRGYLNYTAHGSETSWSSPSFTVTNVNNMTNTDKYFVAVGNCCITNKFDYASGPCFGEAIIRAPNKGGVIYIGGTNNTYWDEDYWWAVGYTTSTISATPPAYDPNNLGAYDAMFHTHGEAVENWAQTAGETVFMGNMAVQASNSSRKNYYWEIYAIMGDPSLMPYYGVPTVNNATYPSTILIGATSINVTAEPYSRVALSMNGVLYGTGIVGAGGSLTMPVANINTTGTAKLVITRSNKQSLIADVTIAPNAGAWLNVNDVVYTDANNNTPEYNETGRFNVTIQNVGNATASNITATLTCSTTGITITDNTESITSLAAGASVTRTNAYTFNIANNIANGTVAAFTITMVSGSDSWTHNFTLSVNAPALAMGNMIIQDTSGNNNGRLDPGETATIIMPLTNNGNAAALSGSATLTSPTNGITVNSGSANFSSIAAGLSTNLSFSVTASSAMSIGTIASFNFAATSGAYTANKTETTPIGLIIEDFEGGNFNSYPWEFSGNLPWTVVSGDAYSGNYSAKSGVITHSQSSAMQTTRVLTSPGQLTFWYKVSSESDYDFLRFYIDGEQQNRWSGTIGWTQATYTLAAGTRVLKWEYTKDGSLSGGSDCAWIDDIVFPASTSGNYYYPPQNLSASVSHQVVNLSWQAPASGTPTSYKIFRNSSLLTTLTALSYSDTAVTNGTTYSYYLKAVYSGGESDATSSVNATPNAIAPTNLVAVAGNGIVNLSWTQASGRNEVSRSSIDDSTDRAISGYRVYRNGSAIQTLTGTSYQDANVINETTYSYYVTTVYSNPAGESGPSNTVQATPTAQTALEVVLGDGGQTTGNQVSSPVNAYYRYRHGQMVYTAAELNAAGIMGPLYINSLGFYVVGVPLYSLPYYIIRMKHTTSTDVSSAQSASGMATVYSNASFLPVADSFNMLNFSIPFLWNGVDNIVVDFAFGQVQPTYSSTGTIKVDAMTNGYRHWQSDTISQTNVFTDGTIIDTRPQIKMTFSPVAVEPQFSINPESHDFGTVYLGSSSTRQFTVTNTGGGTLNISSVSIQGSGNYSIIGLQTLPISLGSGISTSFDVRFSPTSEGEITANLVLVDNLSQRENRIVPLSGIGFDTEITTFPWTEPFDSFPPLGWDTTGGSRSWAAYQADGVNSAYANLWGWNVPNNALLTTPPLRPVNISKLSFKWSHFYNSTYPNDSLRVSYSTDLDDWAELWIIGGETFNSNDGAGNQLPGSFVTKELDLPEGHDRQAFYIRFEAISGYGPNLYLDDVSIIPLTADPLITVNPLDISFGEVEAGSSEQRTLSITNSGGSVLRGTISSLDGFEVSSIYRRGTRNSMEFSIEPGQSNPYTISFNPQEAIAYSGNLQINSNASNTPELEIPVSGEGFIAPTISLNTDYLSASLVAGQETQQGFTITNSGTKPLLYNISMDDAAPTRISTGRTIQAAKTTRSIEGSTLELDNEEYQPGTTLDWSFTVYNASGDTEWLTDVIIAFPEGVTVNSATNFIGGTGILTPDLTSGAGITIQWHGEQYGNGVIYGDESATAIVNVSIAPGFSGDLELGFEIIGDEYGEPPHQILGSIILTQAEPPVEWLSCFPLSGVVEPGQSTPIEVYFSAVNMAAGIHRAQIVVNSNDPQNPQQSIDASMEVSPANQTPVINLPANFSFNRNGSLMVDFSGFVYDADGDDLSLGVSANANISVDIDGMNVTFGAAQDWIGSEHIVFSVSDGNSFSTDTVEVFVNPLNLPNWEPVVYPNNPATIYGQISIEGIPARNNDIVAAFVGSECRGTANVVVIDRATAYATLLVQLNDPNEHVELKVYSYALDSVYDVQQIYQLGFGEVVGLDTPEPIDGIVEITLQKPVAMISASTHGIRIEWQAIARADLYRIFVYAEPDGELISSHTTTDTFWIDSEPSSKRFFRITAEKSVPAKGVRK